MCLAGCGFRPWPQPAARGDCIPDFPYADGWLGGDAVYSVSVPGGEARRETIWLFGDSYVGEPGDRDRVDSRLIHNSVARSSCDESGRFEIDYDWKHDATGAPSAVFEATRAGRYAWPFDGFFVGDQLYVPLLELAPAPPSDELGLHFEVLGTVIARVANPADDVDAWRVDARGLGTGPHSILSTATWVEGDFVHSLATRTGADGSLPRFLVRVPTRAIAVWPEDLAASAETFTEDGTWAPGIEPSRARLLMRDNATEMSIDRDPETGLYFVVYSAPLQTADDGTPSRSPDLDGRSIFLRTAPSLTGPWSTRRRIHEMPEARPSPDRDVAQVEICYAAKGHAAQSPRGMLVMTYVCNLAPGPNGDVWQVLSTMQHRMDIYRPQVVLQPWPPPQDARPPSQAVMPAMPGDRPGREAPAPPL